MNAAASYGCLLLHAPLWGVQTAELSLRQNHMQLLGSWANGFKDFLCLFGPVTRLSPLQTAIVEETPERLWLRLLGLDHDLVRRHYHNLLAS